MAGQPLQRVYSLSRCSIKTWFSYVAEHRRAIDGDRLTVDTENSQKILCIDGCEQSSSPTIVTYENYSLNEHVVNGGQHA